MSQPYAYHIRELTDVQSDNFGCSAHFILEKLEEWARKLPSHSPVLLPDQSGIAQRLQRRLADMRNFVAEYFLLPEKKSIESLISETELIAHDLLKSILESPWNCFQKEAKPVDGKRRFDNTVWREFESILVCSRWCSDFLVNEILPPFVLGYVKSLQELFDRGELISRKAIINLLRALLKFVHTAGVERNFPLSPGTWSDTEKGDIERLHVDEGAMRIAAATGKGLYFNKWQDIEIIEDTPRFEAYVYLKKGAYIMNMSNDYNKTILKAYEYLLISIVKVKTGEVADNQICEVVDSAMRRAIAVAKKGATETARAKHQATVEKGARAQKEKADEVLCWVAAAAQFLLNAFPFLDDSEIAAALSSREKRAARARLLPKPAQKLLLDPPARLGKHRTIRDKITRARALGLIVSPPSPDSSSEEIEPKSM